MVFIYWRGAIGCGWVISYTNAEKALEEQELVALESISESIERHLISFFHGEIAEGKVFALNKAIQDSLAQQQTRVILSR